MTKIEKLMSRAESALDDVFSEKSVSLREALENMQALRDSIDMKIECLNVDIRGRRVEDEDRPVKRGR